MTTKEMLQHPFLTSEDVPKCLTVESYENSYHSLTQIPTFKNDDQPVLSKVKSTEKLRPEDFGRKKPELNLNINQMS
jgi:hypothetical protein